MTILSNSSYMSIKREFKISVIMPTYNACDFLKYSIESVLKQTYTNFELIIINDGSTDDTETKCNQYKETDSRIIYLYQQNKGVSQARNYGLEIASGDFITFVDSDDIIHPTFLEKLIDALNRSGKDIAACFYQITWNGRINTISDKLNSKDDLIFVSGVSLLRFLLDNTSKSVEKKYPIDTIWGKLYKRDITLKEKFKSILAEDVEYNSRIYNKIEGMIIVPEILYLWIQRKGSAHRITSSNMTDHIKCAVQIVENFNKGVNSGRTLALKKLTLNLLAARYNVTNYNIYKLTKGPTLELIQALMKKYIKEFIQNSQIPIYFKIGVMLFYYFPFTYTLVRKFYAFKK